MLVGIILILLGIIMAWSGYSAKWNMEHYLELRARGVDAREYNYHILFRQIWWISIIGNSGDIAHPFRSIAHR